jgi:hypothetical protein
MPVTGPPPMCGCGCGTPVEAHIHGQKWRWKRFVGRHQYRVQKPTLSEEQRQAARVRMRENNPMKRPEVVAKMVASKEGVPFYRSPEGEARVREASRRRMLGPGNPMKDPDTARRVYMSACSRTDKTMTEKWLHEVFPEAVFTGLGTMWIGRRNPDFRIAGKKLCIEVTQHGVFNSTAPIPRTVEGYALPTIKHYEAKGWRCLVVFLQSHRRKHLSRSLRTAIESFISEGKSAIFDLGAFWFVDQSPADTACTTSASPELKPTSPMAS